MPGPSWRRAVLAPLALALMAVVATGCTAWTGQGTDASEPAASATPAAPGPTASSDLLGSGELAGVGDARVAGAVEISRSGLDARVRLSDTEGIPEGASLALVPASAASSACADADVLAVSTPAQAESGAALPLSEPFEDPTVWQQLVVVVPDESGACAWRIVARAPLEWEVEPLRPGLAVIEDGGARAGATGEVSAVDGRVYAYRVARGDAMQAVAERFGVGVRDVLYLNPFRAAPLDPALYADEVLNLALEHR